MKIRKILAVLLCVLTVLSVMTAVAYAANSRSGVIALIDPPTLESTTSAAPATTVDFWSQVGNWWNGFYPDFDKLWVSGFKAVSDFLVLAFRLLLKLVGIGTWAGF